MAWWRLLPPHSHLFGSHHSISWQSVYFMSTKRSKNGKITINQWKIRELWRRAMRKSAIDGDFSAIKAFLAKTFGFILSLGFINGWLLNKRAEKQSGLKLGTVNVPWRCMWSLLSEGLKIWQNGAVFVRKNGILGEFTKCARVCNCICLPLGAQIARKKLQTWFCNCKFLYG